MSRGYAAVGVLLTGVCGVGIVYSSLGLELKRKRAEKLGGLPNQPIPGEKAVSEAIMSDFKEAKDQVVQPGGFAWGIREMIFGRNTQSSANEHNSAGEDANASQERNLKER